MKQNIAKTKIKICAVICEYNPFHNGHRYQLEEIKKQSGCDKILCIMSGNFVQRGEAAILDKHTRAAHAVYAGADCVIELPLPFAVSSAETFALGAVKTLAAIPAVSVLAFGCECGEALDFLNLAKVLLNEPTEFKAALTAALDTGESFARARCIALKKVCPDVDERLFSSPNNILALEYTKAVLRLRSDIRILPLRRIGSDYNEETLTKNYSSASAIRKEILKDNLTALTTNPNTISDPDLNPDLNPDLGFNPGLKNNLPDYVLRDLALALTKEDFLRLDGIEHYALLNRSSEEIALAPDCGEGLENRLKNLAKEYFTAEEVIREATSRRYTAARIRRILLVNALGITKRDTKAFLEEKLYCNVLALNEETAGETLALLKESTLPLLVRKGDENALTGMQKACFLLTEKADGIYASLCQRKLILYAARFIKR